MNSNEKTHVRLKPDAKEKLIELCRSLNVSEQRGRSYVLNELIYRARVHNKTLDLKEFLDSDSISEIRAHYGNVSRIGGNLNQLVHILQIRKLRYESGEYEYIKVDTPFLLDIIDKLRLEIEEEKEKLARFLERY